MLYHTDMNIGRDSLGGNILQHQWWLKTIIDKVVLRRHQKDQKAKGVYIYYYLSYSS